MHINGFVLEMAFVIRYLLIKIERERCNFNCTNTKMSSNQEFTREFFNESSEAWSRNKIKRGHCMVYICLALTKSGDRCPRAAHMKDGTSEYLCKQHRKYYINKMTKED